MKKLLDNLIQSESPSVESDSLQRHGLHSPWNSPGQNIKVDSLSLLQGIFPTQASNPGFPHCRQILYQLSHQGSPIWHKHITKCFYSFKIKAEGFFIFAMWLGICHTQKNSKSHGKYKETSVFILKKKKHSLKTVQKKWRIRPTEYEVLKKQNNGKIHLIFPECSLFIFTAK